MPIPTPNHVLIIEHLVYVRTSYGCHAPSLWLSKAVETIRCHWTSFPLMLFDTNQREWDRADKLLNRKCFKEAVRRYEGVRITSYGRDVFSLYYIYRHSSYKINLRTGHGPQSFTSLSRLTNVCPLFNSKLWHLHVTYNIQVRQGSIEFPFCLNTRYTVKVYRGRGSKPSRSVIPNHDMRRQIIAPAALPPRKLRGLPIRFGRCKENSFTARNRTSVVQPEANLSDTLYGLKSS